MNRSENCSGKITNTHEEMVNFLLKSEKREQKHVNTLISSRICNWLIDNIKERRHKRICGLTLGPTFTGHKSKNYIFSYTFSIHYNEICNFNGGLNTKVIGNLNLNYMLIALLPWFSLATNSLIYYPIPWFVLAINYLGLVFNYMKSEFGI